jgi:hypothetical protein
MLLLSHTPKEYNKRKSKVVCIQTPCHEGVGGMEVKLKKSLI